MNDKTLRLKIKKFKPRKGDLFFFSCEGLSGIEIDSFRQQIDRIYPGLSIIITNYELKVKRVTIQDIPMLRLHCEGQFSYDNLRDIEDAVVREIQNAGEPEKKIETPPKLKSRYDILKKENNEKTT